MTGNTHKLKSQDVSWGPNLAGLILDGDNPYTHGCVHATLAPPPLITKLVQAGRPPEVWRLDHLQQQQDGGFAYVYEQVDYRPIGDDTEEDDWSDTKPFRRAVADADPISLLEALRRKDEHLALIKIENEKLASRLATAHTDAIESVEARKLAREQRDAWTLRAETAERKLAAANRLLAKARDREDAITTVCNCCHDETRHVDNFATHDSGCIIGGCGCRWTP